MGVKINFKDMNLCANSNEIQNKHDSFYEYEILPNTIRNNIMCVQVKVWKTF